MSRFELNICIDNAAFGERPSEEVARILREAADNVLANDTIGRIRDGNGQRVGFWAFKH